MEKMDKEKQEIIKRLRGENTVQEVKITEIDLTYINVVSLTFKFLFASFVIFGFFFALLWMPIYGFRYF